MWGGGGGRGGGGGGGGRDKMANQHTGQHFLKGAAHVNLATLLPFSIGKRSKENSGVSGKNHPACPLVLVGFLRQ